jgi:MinD-like ATPase involved in chromosome partitioning or flagellar assembly
MILKEKSSRIITFYSYKGGTGRSMALANVAWILASQGKRVLMVDWDLEAPGLHRYIHPFLKDKGLIASEGVIDLMTKFEGAAISPRQSPDDGSMEPDAATYNQRSEPDGTRWYLPLADISAYCLPLAWSFPHNGSLDLLPAGKQGPTYSARVTSFNWTGFYDRLGGGVFLETVMQNMRDKYEYILVDSRTGLSDIAGVCTIQLPDTVVICFTLNIQSIEGAAAVASSIRRQRKSDSNFRIYPVPMRIERAEKEQLDRALEFAKRTFTGFIDHMPESKRDEYWGEIGVQYEPFYAYQEILATIGDAPGVRTSMLTSFERLVDFLTDDSVKEKTRLDEDQRRELRTIFLRGPQSQSVQSILSRHPELQVYYERCVTRQRAWLQSKRDNAHLLSAAQVKQLQNNIELMMAMLEEAEFRLFWDLSRRRLQAIERRRVILIHIGVLALGGILPFLSAVIPYYILRKDNGMYYTIRVLAMAAFFGMIGSETWLLFSSYFLRATQAVAVTVRPALTVFVAVVTFLAAGGLSGIVAVLTSDALLLTSHSYLSRAAFAFLGGFVGSRLIPNMAESLVITLRPSEGTSHPPH